MCDKCKAIQPMTNAYERMSYKNFSSSAPYVNTVQNHESYMRAVREPSVWSEVPGWTFESVTFDVMHIIFMGIARNHVPSCLKLMKLGGFGYVRDESDAMFLKRASIEMKEACKAQKFPDLALSERCLFL